MGRGLREAKDAAAAAPQERTAAPGVQHGCGSTSLPQATVGQASTGAQGRNKHINVSRKGAETLLFLIENIDFEGSW